MIYLLSYILAFIPLGLIIGIFVKVKNKKRLKKNGKFILACNHLSNWDAVTVLYKRFKPMKFLAKKELMNTPFKRWFLRGLGAIPIDRENPEISSIKEVLRQLKNNKPVCIFPSGTRMNDPHMSYDSVKDGIALFAVKAQADVVPAMFIKKNRAFHRNVLLIGEPISPANYTTDKVSLEVFAHVVCDAMNKLLEDYYAEKK